MITTTFPYNPVLAGMRYQGEELTLVFKKKQGTQERTYAEVPAQVAYKLVYAKSASELLSWYAKEVRKKFKVINVK